MPMRVAGRGVAVIVVVLLLATALTPVPAEAGSTAANVALGLAAFAVFNQLIGWSLAPAYAEPVVVYSAPPVYVAPGYAGAYVYPTPRVAVAQPSSGIVEYPHGRYELRGDGVSVAYHWVWIPKAPPVPPAGPPPAPPSR